MHSFKWKVKSILIASGLMLLSLSVSSQAVSIIDKDSLSFGSLLSVHAFKPAFNLPQSSKFIINAFDASTLPVFCKIEHKIESASKIAFRFRLGELNYVNMLENKQ